MRHKVFFRVALAAVITAACGGDATGPVVPVATPTQLSFSSTPSATAQSGIALAVQPAVRLRDADNKFVAKAGVVVTVTATGPAATLTGATASTDGSGTATFTSLTLTGTAGTFTLHFSATGLTVLDAPALTLGAGTPSQLALTTAPPATAQAGVALSVQPAVQVRDASGNAVSQAGITVTAGTVSGTANITNSTAQTNASGLAAFSGLTLAGSTGSYTMRFSAPGLSSADAPSATSLAAGAPTQLSLSTQPSATVSNGAVLAVQPVVQLRDAFGNNATQAGVAVVASVVTGPAGSTLSGDTAVTDATGKAAFTALKITGTAGNYSLRFASAPLASVVSAAAVALTAGAATHLGIATSPSTTAQNGAAIATQPVVQLLDQSANAVPQAGVVVTASIFSGTGTLANATATTDATGKATFSGLAITGTVGFFSLQFAAPSLGTVNSNAVALAPGPAAGLSVVTQPAATATNGGVLSRQPAVKLVDQSGNAVNLAGTVITASLVSGSAAIASGTATTSAAGVATFAGLALTGTTGSYTFRFAATGLTSVDATTPTVLAAGAATQLGLTTPPPASGASAATLAPATVVQLLDVSGNAAAQSGVVITASIVGGGATLGGATATTTAAGAATFSALTISGIAGPYTLRFSATGLTSVDAATPTTIGAGAAAQLALTSQPPTAAQSGIALITQPVVQVQDGAGNAKAQAGIVVTASVVSGSVTIANATATTDAAGTATFIGLTISGGTGNYTLRFSASGLTAATAVAATSLGAGAAAQLGVTTQPSVTARSGIALGAQPVVQVQDASGNAVAASGVAVTASIVSGSVTLANFTATTDVSGRATFAGLSLTALVGSYRLQFTAPSLTTATAAASTVLSGGVAASLTITTQPSTTGNVAAALAAQPAIQLRDALGNPAPDAGVVVTATVVSGSVTLTNATATSNASGLATFSGLALTALTGSYTLRFGASGLGTVDAGAATALAVGAPAQLTVTAQPSSSAVNGAVLAAQPAVQLLDAGGNLVTNSGVVITASSAGTTITGNQATTNASGIATFSSLAIFGSATTHVLQFGGTGLLTASASVGTTLTPGAPASIFIVTLPPTTAQSGVPMSAPPEIEVRDVSGNPVAGIDVLTRAPGNPGIIIVTSGHQVTDGAGRAVFTGLTITAPASGYSLRFCVGTVNCGPIVQGSPTPTAITTGAAAILTVTTQPPAATVNGAALPSAPVVDVTDLAGNPVSGIVVTATTTAGATITNGTATTDAAGSATFPGMVLTGTAGNYVLHFAAGAASGDAAGAIALGSSAPANISITTAPPANAVNGTLFSPQPSVTVTDMSGNPVAGAVVTASTSAGVVVANPTATTNASGVATFSGLALTGLANNYAMQFQSGAASVTAGTPTTLVAGTAVGFSIQTQPSFTAANGDPFPTQPVVRVFDGSNNGVASVIVTVTAAGATSVINGTATTNGSGIATFSGLAIVGPVGNYQLSFSSQSLLAQDASSPTALGVGSARRVELTTEPSTAAPSSVPLVTQPAVKIVDASGQLVTAGSKTVTVSVASGSATITAPSVNTASGTATFAGLAVTALIGNYRLVFSSPGLVSDTSAAAVAISAGPANRLSMLTEASKAALADSVWDNQPAVRVLDLAGNPVALAGANVTVSTVSGSPTFTGTTTLQTDAQGQATFSGLAIRPAGNYRLRFTASPLSPVNASDTIVVAGSVVNNAPTTISGGVISAQTVAVRVFPGDTLLRVVLDTLQGQTGDADLYVRFGTATDVGNDIHDCFPNLAGSREVCTFRTSNGTLQAGLYYITVYAFFAFTNVTLTVTRQ